ncbi:amidohydrolase family protein [Nocardia puris]|uniref:5-methylthioadenosine/S-adenosylhomocysteine deaminase n=1 Tax=Nocardia puris TaxID=208602 RepID=A0A366E2A7_9NOCA|nr:amidohydrolase family protein [Nocardia puris]MBF6212680.1 amidohydrolase family protein [Nocardia puris]MBF6367618.1 amidohydrolase family protein [Nocardia puris]MBF6461269.1 amidohydrolase family protein [Nocardia puris]RBO96501.1 5-methylthioadenosine/S-adenosylhomocysteine deaminase [Nocardia puris]
MTTTVTGVTVYTGGGWLPDRDVLIEDGLVTAIAPAGTAGAGGVDGRGGYLIPGFVNTHTHLQQSLQRGIAEGTPLLEWLLAVGAEAVAITPERAYTATVAAALEALRSGTTTLMEHMWPHPSAEVHDAVVRGLRDTGIRAVLGRGIADRADASRRWGFEPRLMQPLDDVLAHTEQLLKDTEGSVIQVGLAVPNPRSVTPEGMGAIGEFARERGLPVSIHLLETPTDDLMCREHAGLGAVDYLDAHGFLWDRVLAVHCVALDESGRRTLAERGVAVSYNPVSNMRLGSGVAAVPDLLDAGVAVGLGVDGAASNDTQDMLESLRAGAYVQRAVRGRADLLGFADMLDIASGGANSALGLPARSGGVTVGDVADLTLLRFERDFATLPVRDPGASILTTGSSRIVDTVLVGGEVVVRDGRSTRVDEAELVRELVALG